MLLRIAPGAAPIATAVARPERAAAHPGKSFSVILREQPTSATPAAPSTPRAGGPLGAAPADRSAPGLAVRHMERIIDSQRQLERAMRRALHGADFTPAQLLSLQFQVQQFSLEVETVSRVVDRVTGAVKTAMQTQI